MAVPSTPSKRLLGDGEPLSFSESNQTVAQSETQSSTGVKPTPDHSGHRPKNQQP